MDDMQAFERRVATEVVQGMGPSEPVDDAAIFTAITTTPSPKWRFQSMFSATKFVVAGVIVALFGGFLLAGVLTTEPEETMPAVGATMTPESTTYPPIELPAEIPQGIEWGMLETPLGPARWAHLGGDVTSLPPDMSGPDLSGIVISTPEGYVMPAWGDEWWGGGEAKLWRSSDLIGWTSEPLGIEGRGGELSRAGDTYWLNIDGPGSLWRSPDTKSWERIGLERLVPPGPEGFAWTLRPGRPLTHGGVTIVPFEWVTDSWIVTRGLSGADQLRAVTLVETSPGIFDIEEMEYCCFDLGTFATVRFEETADGLRVLDHEDGRELKTLEGVSMEFIRLLAYRFAGEELVDVKSEFDDIAWQPLPRLAILDGSTLVEVEPPLESEPYRQAYTVDQDGFVSVSIGPDGLAHMHRSEDGREWSEIDVIGDDVGEPSDLSEVWSDRGSVQMGNSVEIWTLTDELEWESHAPVPLWTEPYFFPIGSGWILGPFDTNPVTGVQDVGPGNIIPQIWFQPAEGEPVPIDVTDMAMPAEVGNCGAQGGWLSPNTIVGQFHEGCGGVREAWVITFDDVPA